MTLIYMIALVVLLIGVGYLYRLPIPLFGEEFATDTSTSVNVDKFLEECYKKQCNQLELEFEKECKGMRLKCADQHLYDYQKCNQEILKACSPTKLQTCVNTCKSLAEIEKQSQQAVKQQTVTALPVSGKYLLEEEVDLSERYRIIPSPVINMYYTPEYSLSFFVNVESSSPSWRSLIYFTNKYSERTPAIWIHPGNTLRLQFRHATQRNPLGAYVDTVPGAVRFGERFHVGIVLSNSKITLYIDGQKSNEVSLPAGDMFVWGRIMDKVMYLRHPSSSETQRGYLRISHIYWSQTPLDQTHIAQLAGK